MIFFSLSLSGSLIALLLLLLKPLIKDRMSKRWQYYIFLIVVVRFLFPFGPETSLMGTIFKQAGGYVAAENSPAAMPNGAGLLQIPPDETQIIYPNENAMDSPYHAVNVGQMKFQWLWLVWLVPAVVFLLRKIVGYFRFSRSIKAGCTKIENARLLEVYQKVCSEMHIKYRPGLVLNEKAASPMLVGAIRPVIILPDMNAKDNELGYMLRHELTHHKRLDIVYKWFVQIAVCLHWFNPFVYWISREVNRNCELSCDEAVIRRLDQVEQRAYGDMLLQAIRINQMTPRSVVSITLNEDTKLIKERLGAIMKYRKRTKSVMVISTVLAIVLMCGATFAGAYETTKPPQSEKLKNTAPISPIVIDTDIAAGGKIALGSQQLLSGTICKVSLEWIGGTNLTVLCTSTNGLENIYHIENGKAFTFQINTHDEYIITVMNRDTKSITNVKGSISFNEQTILYQNVEMRRYVGEDGHPYIHDIKTNNTSKKIVGCQHGMLAFDKSGNPLKIDWWSLDTELEGAYHYLYSRDSTTILPGETSDVHGGWSLNYYGTDSSVDQIAYILYCDKEITFEDGTVWVNPDFDKWLKTYEGKIIDVEVLENYYPYEQKLEL